MLQKFSLQTQLIVLMVTALILLSAGLTAVQTVRVQRVQINSERERSLALISSVNSTIQAVAPLIATLNDMTELSGRLSALVQQSKDVDFIAVAWRDGEVIFHSDPAYKDQVISTLADLPTRETERADVGSFGPVYLTTQVMPNPVEEGPGQYQIVVAMAAEPIDSALRTTLATTVAIALVAVLIVAGLLALQLRTGVSNPVERLTEGARIFSKGRLDHRIHAGGSRELIMLADTLNQMANELQQSRVQVENMNRVLEQRVSERMQEIATVAEVSSQVASILETDELLQTLVDVTKADFGLYHAHIYLLDATGQTLVLAAGAGEVGQQLVAQGHRIPIDLENSLVARAARIRQSVAYQDVSNAPHFLPNPLLPSTASEMAVCLMARTQLLGVLDVQSDEVGRFGPEMQTVMETLGRQIAIALSNARLFGEVERTSRREQTLSMISQQMQAALNLDEVLQTATRELGRVLRVPHTAIALRVPAGTEQAETPASEQEAAR
ncbi:MAG: GAF domain-containing protein [Chloroflexi bacterium]|nr:GAF domain-containing protein [Chloroflexota bacterium]